MSASTDEKTRTETKIRHVRVADDPWITAATRANEDGETISTVVRILLRKYAKGEIDL